MSLNEEGRTGVKVNLTADGVFGVVTQDPESMLSSPGGLTNADGNTGYGVPFQLSARCSHTTSTTTIVNLASSDLPFKMRVLSAEVQCLDDGKGASSGGQNGCVVGVSQGGSASIGSVDCGGMRTGERRAVELGFSGNELIASNGSLRVVFKSRLGLHDKAFTYELVCTLNCVREI